MERKIIKVNFLFYLKTSNFAEIIKLHSIKKTTTKILLAFLSAIIMCANVFAQGEQEKNAKYIFEGKLIFSKTCHIQTGEYSFVNYTSYLIQVEKVIKGNITVGTIEILQPREGVVYDDGTRRENLQFSEKQTKAPSGLATFYCNDLAEKVETGVKNTNAQSILFFDAISLEKKVQTQATPVKQ